MHVHRTVFPHTDYGYTWIETVWFCHDGRQISPFIPSGGCCERTGDLPGGAPDRGIGEEIRHYCGADHPQIIREPDTVKSDWHRVTASAIVPMGGAP